MDASQIVGPYGSVIIPCVNEKNEPKTVTFTLAPLSLAEELALDADLRALVDAERADKRNRQLADIGATGGSWAHKQYVAELVRYVMEPATIYDVNAKRFDLAGVRTELWHRAKKTQPALTREQVESVVTTANAVAVREQIDVAINPPNPSGQQPTKS